MKTLLDYAETAAKSRHKNSSVVAELREQTLTTMFIPVVIQNLTIITIQGLKFYSAWNVENWRKSFHNARQFLSQSREIDKDTRSSRFQKHKFRVKCVLDISFKYRSMIVLFFFISFLSFFVIAVTSSSNIYSRFSSSLNFRL